MPASFRFPGLLVLLAMAGGSAQAQTAADRQVVYRQAVIKVLQEIAAWPGLAGQSVYLAPGLSSSAERPPFEWADAGRQLPDTLLSQLRREGLIAGPCTAAAGRTCAEAASGVRIRFTVIRQANPDEGRLVAQVKPFWEPGSILTGPPASILLGLTALRVTVAPVGQLSREVSWVITDAIVLP